MLLNLVVREATSRNSFVLVGDIHYSSDTKFVKISDLTKLYSQSLETLEITLQNRIHSTRLENCILTHFPGMYCFTDRGDDGF